MIFFFFGNSLHFSFGNVLMQLPMDHFWEHINFVFRRKLSYNIFFYVSNVYENFLLILATNNTQMIFPIHWMVIHTTIEPRFKDGIPQFIFIRASYTIEVWSSMFSCIWVCLRILDKSHLMEVQRQIWVRPRRLPYSLESPNP